jgi:hypothetical protein
MKDKVMKMTAEHYDFLKAALSHVRRDLVKKHYANLTLEPKVYNVERRLRFDILYSCMRSNMVCDMFYPYLNDDHIDTAVKAALKELKVEFV